MAFQRPTLQQIVDRVTQDFISRLGLTGGVLRRSMIYVLARVIAGAAHMLYGFIAWVARQILPDTQDEDYLVLFASRYNITRRAATYAAGNVVFTGIDDTVIDAGTVIQRADGVQYATDAEATLASGTATVAVTALAAGLAGNADAGVAMTIVEPIAGADALALVGSGGLSAGEDVESIDSLRARVVERMREPPLGGSQNDYVKWAKEVSGVTRVWVTPLASGAGTVGVIFVCDNEVDIIPDSGKVAEVQAWIDRPDKRPVTAVVTVAAPTALEVDFTIAITPSTDAVKAAVEAELRDLLQRVGEPGGTVYLSQIREAVSIAAGEVDNSVTAPAANVSIDVDEIPVMGTITWA